MNNNCRFDRQPPENRRNERITLIVVIITLTMMVIEIVAGILSSSMALLADGIHMGTHALALCITLGAYIVARRHRQNPRFSFGTGKVGVLGGYTNAVLLIIAGLAIAYESVARLIAPVSIRFNEAIAVAVIGLIVNVACAFILSKGNAGYDHPVGHAHHHQPRSAGKPHHHQDHNLRAAYLHVITDALTSILAIVALLIGRNLGWIWADPLVGILGAIVIVKWAVGLIRQTGTILLDLGDFSAEILAIRQRLEKEGAAVGDIHIWPISENKRSLIVSLSTASATCPADYHAIIDELSHFDHVTVEVNHLPSGTENSW
jgi:cation diffusion facilitator family transporter